MRVLIWIQVNACHHLSHGRSGPWHLTTAPFISITQPPHSALYLWISVQVEEEAAASQLALNLPMLALGSADLGPLVASLASGLPPARQLLGQDMGE